MKEDNWIDLIDWEKYRAPFCIKYDNEYFSELKNKLNDLIQDMEKAKAQKKYINIVKKYVKAIEETMDNYYMGNIFIAQKIINRLIKGCIKSKIAVSNINNSIAFKGSLGTEVQFFRARLSDNAIGYKANEMLHIPFDRREIVKSERFSVPGLPCLYLGNTTYDCWIEMGCPPEYRFNVSPIILDNTQTIFNLAISATDIINIDKIDKIEEDCLKSLLKLFVLMIATSFRVEQKNRNFKSEYIISQLIMLACKSEKIDGITYYSKQVSRDVFAIVGAVNLVLFANYKEGKRISEICNHIKIDDSFNYSVFKQLLYSNKYKEYDLRIDTSQEINNIGEYNKQFPYKQTEFYEFDKFLFANWKRKNI